ncbi:MAG: hypothetical protein JW896_05665 [Deltaproteobacteria bacterium]|nr:hypothetical protein [Deltaproteobacteria bacterium]
MKHWGWRILVRVVWPVFLGVGLIQGCESGEKVVDEVTGNRAVKQYQKVEKGMEKLERQQAERYESILGVEEEDQGKE